MSTLAVRRDPFAPFFYTPFRAPLAQAWAPAAEVNRDGADAVVKVEIPGLNPSDINVEIADGRLVISGEKRDQRSENAGGRSLREVRYGSFRRSFGLPKHVTGEAITASYDAGVLHVRVAGVYAEAGATKIPVQGGAPRPEVTEGSDAS
jgi:HSP20 family molecular chaperone IbpA